MVIIEAWIITGGTDSGVVKFVGQAKEQQSADIPTIGITAWGDLKPIHKKQLVRKQDDVRIELKY